MTRENGEKSSLLVRGAQFACAILLACVAFNLLEYGRLKSLTVAQTMYFRRDIVYAAVYLGTYTVSITAILVALFSRSAIARWASLVVVFVFVAIDVCCRLVTGDNISFTEVQTAMYESSFAGEFLRSYAGSVRTAVLVAGVITGGFWAAVHWSKARFGVAWLGLVPLAGVLIYGILWKTVAANNTYPAPFRVPVLIVYTSLNSLYAGPREPVDMAVTAVAQPRAVIVIVDESVRGDLLGINGSARDTTPYLASMSDRYLNFGVACAASNLSSSTNAILRSGLRLDQLPDQKQRALKQPSIFQYAKAAGYRTCFLDAQYVSGKKSNYMSDRDLAGFDVVYWAATDEPDSTKRYRRDQLLAQRIIELLADGEPTFIWANKYGAHFHYEQTYPEEERVFVPSMKAGAPIDTSTMEEVQNSYANALRWSVDSFFRTIAPLLDDDTVVLYTSDHGQSFKEGSRTSTHGNRIAPPKSQAKVPLLGWGGLLKQRFPDGIAAFRDRVSHYQVFPTLLVLMGFDEAEVVSRYGPPLWDPPDGGRVFLSGDVFGRGSVRFNAFDDVADPPVTGK